jgi:hypothetical protein
MFKISRANLVDVIVLLIIYAFLFSYYTPEYMLSATTTTGGDMGSHYAISQYLHDYLLPHGQLIGWYPHWMGGIPLLQFYFIPPYLLIVLLSYLIPMQIAFKLVTILGVLLLPICAYASFRLFGFNFPTPSLGAAMTLPFLFMESYSFYGGNIKSTLAGQFPHGISFALTLLSVALIFYGMKRNKFLALNSLLLSLAVLTHVYTTIVLAGTLVLFLIRALIHKKHDQIKYLIYLGILSFLLTSFWIVPLFSKFSFTAAPKDNFSGGLGDAFINDFVLFYALALICIFAPMFGTILRIFRLKPGELGIINTDERLTPLYFFFLASALFYVLNDHTILLRIRFLPQLYFLPLMFAAVGISLMAGKLKGGFLIPIITVLFITGWISTGILGYLPQDLQSGLATSPYVSHGLKDVPGWIKWNYEGLESKAKWPTYKQLTDYMSTLDNSGRINVEYSTDYNSYGTPRLFEASPVFTNRSVMEGLLLESSVTFPFLYYLNKEVSHDSWWPGFPIKEPKINLTLGAQDLGLYNVKYFIVSSDKIKEQIKGNELYTYLKSIGEFDIYSLNSDSQYIEPVKKEPVLVVTDDWKSISYQWMTSGYKDVPLVFARDYGDYESRHFRLIILDKQLPVEQKGDIVIFSKDRLLDALASSRNLSACRVTMGEISEEEFTAQTDCIDKPVSFKTSYFPNWMAEGGGKIYMASPSTMLFFPEKQDIRIYYGTTTADYLGASLTLAGILLVLYIALLSRKSFKETIHTPLATSLSATKPACAVLSASGKTRNELANFYSQLLKKKYPIIVVILLIIAGYALTAHMSKSGECAAYCESQGYIGSSQSFFGLGDNVDTYRLGYAHGDDSKRHNFVCEYATCDPSRTDQVYVSGGYVEFDMNVLPGTDNLLTLRLLDNTNCRAGDLYIDGEFIRNITGEGIYDWHNFDFPIPAKYLAKEKIKVKLAFNSSECYGWDLAMAAINTPSCKCSKI